MKHTAADPSLVRRLAVTVRGVVQGVGFRPFVYNAARRGSLTGWVKNDAHAVRIEAQGKPAELDVFLDTVRRDHPPQARIEAMDVGEIPCAEDGKAETFQILQSSGQTAPRPTIPADLATCDECLREIRTPGERRFGYPFTNCTNCGPRWSIIERLPYDRPRTSMARFAMCDDCRAEYDDPSDRRFHAQPIACPRCGPLLRLLDTDGSQTAVGEEAAAMAAEAILAGRIVALKGLGGFQLLVDATNPEAVARLRRRKQRPDRPFALMMSTLEDIRRRCQVSDDEARVLSSHEAPIVLLKRRTDAKTARDVAETVAPDNPYLGAMLPCTPLHHLLTAAIDRPVICTSGNLSEEPMAISTAEALERLAPIADLILTHDRPIVRPVDDSVVRIGHGGQQVLRRARGFAPLPIRLDRTTPTVLALGGHLKNTVALALPNPTRATSVVISPHVGDLDNVLSVEVHRRAAGDLVDFFEARPDVLVCDLHPDYASTRHAEHLAGEWGVPLYRVQHHQAHVAACMAEHGLDGPVLGLAWDGTGYGGDGTIWGGEALVCDGADFSRTANLRTFPLPGGDRAARQPRRSALGLLFEIMGREAAHHTATLFADSEVRTLLTALDRSINAPRTSSMGRLFDAVAALCGLPPVISFEGQAAMALEFAAAEFAADAEPEDAYSLPLSDGTPAVADWEPLIRSVLADRAAGLPVGQIAMRLHNALAELAVAVARRAGCRQVVLSGGCFQNAILTERVDTRLSQAGFTVYTHHRVPPGDGGIALGQVFLAAAKARQ